MKTDRKTRAMRPRRRVETCQKHLSAQRNGQSYLLLTYQRMEFTSPIRNKTGGKRVCGGLWSKHAYGQQQKPELCRIGNRKGL